MSQFHYFLTIPGNEDLLKEEIKTFYPHLHFAYSKPGFCTFKNTDESSELNIPVVYALSYGKTLSRIKLSEVNRIYEELRSPEVNFNFFQIEHEQSTAPWIPEHEFKECAHQVDFIRTGKDEVFVGQRLIDQWNSPFMRRFQAERTELISRAYYKIADSFLMFKTPDNLKVLELGSVPGGISQYLLERGHRVTAVDPGQMHESILANKKFKFINKPVQEYNPYPSERFDILVSDMNLNPKMVLKQSARLLHTLSSVREAFITIKTSKPEMVKDITGYRQMMKDIGFSEIHFLQLPYHRREFLAYGKRRG